MTTAALRAYYADIQVGKWGETERAAAEQLCAAKSRAQILAEISIDFDGAELALINKAIKLARTSGDMRSWHSAAGR